MSKPATAPSILDTVAQLLTRKKSSLEEAAAKAEAARKAALDVQEVLRIAKSKHVRLAAELEVLQDYQPKLVSYFAELETGVSELESELIQFLAGRVGVTTSEDDQGNVTANKPESWAADRLTRGAKHNAIADRISYAKTILGLKTRTLAAIAETIRAVESEIEANLKEISSIE